MAKENYSQLLKEFENRQTVLKSMPACFYIESVRGCLGKCAMCGMHHTPPRLISEDLLNKIEPYFNRLEVLGIHGGGEPLLGNIPYFVEQSVKHNFAIHMNTTGVFLSKEMADLLLKTRLSIIFSVHAGKPDTYKKIMGYDFKKVLGNINYLAQKDKEKKKGSVLGFSFIVMKENIDEIEDFLKIARDAGMGSVRFMRLRPNKHILQGVKMPERQLEFNYHEQYNAGIKREFLKRLPIYKELAGKLGIRITHGSMEFTARYSPFTLTGRREPCKAPWLGQLQIKQDGSVHPCCGLNYPLGNINDFTLEEIWNSAGIQRLRTSFKNGGFPLGCKSCQAVSGLPLLSPKIQ